MNKKIVTNSCYNLCDVIDNEQEFAFYNNCFTKFALVVRSKYKKYTSRHGGV